MGESKDNKQAGTAQASRALSPLQETAGLVARYAANLIDDKRAQQFHAQLSLMAKQDPKIATCTNDSILTAMMACVHLDLMPNTPQQHAFVIPYNNKNKGVVELQFQLGYKGLKVLAERSGQVKKIEAELVFEGDKFSYQLGLNRKLTHRPSMDVNRTDYKLVKAAYTVILLSNGEQVFDVMTRPELNKIQDTAKASATDAPWKKWPEAMAKKTVLKRALKLVPSSAEDNRLEYAAIYDSWAEAGKLRVGEKGKLEQGSKDQGKSEEQVKNDAKQILNNLDSNKTVEGPDPHKTADSKKEAKQ